MYTVEIKNGETTTPIHDLNEKIKSGKVVQGINMIDTFSFSLLPSNAGFKLINDYQTHVSVYNTNKNRYDFIGRVLYSKVMMDSSGKISKEVICESYLGFLCDSVQIYMAEQNWTVNGLLQHIIDVHNSQVEEYKQFTIGEVTVTDNNDNLYLGIQRDNSWNTLKAKLVDKLGGEFRFRVVDGVTYIDFLKIIGETLSTEIAVSKNMKSITRENNPTKYISRLIPLGARIVTTDDKGNNVETEERLDITSVNNGVNYIEDEEAIEAYGIRYGYVEFDDVTIASNLLQKGREYLAEKNKVQIKYTISALDLSLLGFDINDFNVCNYYPIKNHLLGINDIARIIKKTIDICEEIKSTIEVGDNFKTLSDLQIERDKALEEATKKIERTKNELKEYVSEKNSATNDELKQIINESNTSLINNCNEIILSALKSYVETGDFEEYKNTVQAQLEIIAGEIAMNFTTTTEQITNVDGNLQSKFIELYKYIRFANGSIILGSNENNITLTIENDVIVFKKNGVQFGWWDGVDFHTGNIVVEVNERAQFGNFAFIPRSDGSLMFLKVGNE